jgi:hypothetical protein
MPIRGAVQQAARTAAPVLSGVLEGFQGAEVHAVGNINAALEAAKGFESVLVGGRGRAGRFIGIQAIGGLCLR